MAQENNTISIHNSSIKKIKEPDFSKEVVIDRVRLLTEPMFRQQQQILKQTFGDKLTDAQIVDKINDLVIRDTIFDIAMKIIVPCYEIKIADKDIAEFADAIRKQNPFFEKAPKDYVELVARRSIEKQLVFIALAQEWKINPTDEDAKKMLMDYYKATNIPVRDKLNNPEELNRVKSILLEQVVANRICASLKCKIDREAITKNAMADIAAAKKAAEEAKAKAEEKK